MIYMISRQFFSKSLEAAKWNKIKIRQMKKSMYQRKQGKKTTFLFKQLKHIFVKHAENLRRMLILSVNLPDTILYKSK